MEKSLVFLSWWKQQEGDAHTITYGEAGANIICKPYRYSAVLHPIKTTGMGGDYRLYGFVIELRGPYDTDKLADLFSRITNEIRGINRVVIILNICGNHSNASRLRNK